MRSIPLVLVVLIGCRSAPLLRPDLSRIDDGRSWQLTNAETHAETVEGRSALRLYPEGGNRKGSNVAIASPVGLAMSTGTIEVDLKGNGEQAASFLGVAFNISDSGRYEAVYFRPFNFRAPDAEHRGHAVQYVAWPQFTWEALRKEMPGRYESEVASPPDPAGWFHARVEVGATDVKVFVDRASTPCLAVKRLVPPVSSTVGLWVDSQEAWFADLVIEAR